MKVPCAFLASKILLLVLLGCDRAASNPSHYDVLMIGNSYTMQNGGVDQILQGLLTEAPNVSGTGQRLANGGMRLSQHAIRWQGSVLDTGSFDYVVLQDQSSTPAYHTTHSSFLQSQDGAIILDERAERIGAEVIFFLTWGRRQSVYALIQENLVTGYTTYAQAVTDGPRKPYIAPVGLAFKKIYDDEVAQGKDPINDSTTVFYGLYSGDNSHVTRRGAYLAGCVFFSTITGQSSVDLNDPYGSTHMDPATRKKLQEAADYAVFTDTTFTSKGYGYPWQGAGVTVPAPTHPPTPLPTPPPVAATSFEGDGEGESNGNEGFNEGETGPPPTRPPTPPPTNPPAPPPTRPPTHHPEPPPTRPPTRPPTPRPTDSPTVNNERDYTFSIEVGPDDMDSILAICAGLEEYLEHTIEETYGHNTRTTISCERGRQDPGIRLLRLLSGRRLFDDSNSIVVSVATTFDEQETPPPVEIDFGQFVEDQILSEEAQTELPELITKAAGGSGVHGGLHAWRTNTTNTPVVLDFDANHGGVAKIRVTKNGSKNGTSGAPGTPYFPTLVVTSVIGWIITMLHV